MPYQTTVQVVGLKEALVELNKVDKKARRQLTKDVQPIGKRFADAIIPEIPMIKIHRGYRYKWTTRKKNGEPSGKRILPFEQTKIGDVKVKINTRRARSRNRAQGAQYETLSVFSVWFTNRFLSVAEFAGTGKVSRTRPNFRRVSDNFVDLIKSDYGPNGGRIVWATVDDNPKVTKELEDAIRETVNDAIKGMKI